MSVLVVIVQPLSLSQEYYHVHSHLKDDEQRAYYKQLEAATSILDTMEGETLSNMSVSVYLYLTECIQLVTEDAISRKRRCHQEQEWSDGKLQYLLRLRRAIITCVCIHMLSDEDCEENDKVLIVIFGTSPTSSVTINITHARTLFYLSVNLS